MSTITTIAASDILSDSRGVINTNFANLNTDKLENITGENFSTLSDVTITSIASGELLKWNGSAWINQTRAELGFVTGGTDNALIRADGTGGAKIQPSGITIDDSDNMVGGNAGGMTVARISGSTFSTIQHLQDVFHSAGWISGGGITDDADGTITVATGTGLIRATDSAVVEILFTDWSAEAGANVNLADNDVNWIYVEYNAGSPRVIATTTERTDINTNILLGVIQRTGTTLHINTVGRMHVGDHAAQMILRIKDVAPFSHVSGAIISATGTRNLAATAGSFWEGITAFATGSFDHSSSGSFSYWYRLVSDSGWTEVASQTQIHQSNYDDNSGTLATLSPNKYGVHWVYTEVDNHVHVVYGQGDYTLTEAQDASPPSGVPEPIEVQGILIGKVIIRKDEASFTQIETAFNGQFTPSVATDHGNLAGLTDVADHPGYLLADGTRNLNYAAVPSDDSGLGEIISIYNLGATIAVGEEVYMGSGGKWLKADASAVSTSGDVWLGICLVAGNDNSSTEILTDGLYRDDSQFAFTIGKAVYISETAGDFTQTAPTTTDAVVRVVGFAASADVIRFNPSPDHITVT